MPKYRCTKEVIIDGSAHKMTIPPGEIVTRTVIEGSVEKHELVYGAATGAVVAVLSSSQLQKLEKQKILILL
jgi:hypothetical protein